MASVSCIAAAETYAITDLGNFSDGDPLQVPRPSVITRNIQVAGSAWHYIGLDSTRDIAEAFLWDKGIFSGLGSGQADFVGHGSVSTANGMNDSGQIVGARSYFIYNGIEGVLVTRAISLQNNAVTILGSLGGGSTTNSSANGINAAGQIVGRSDTSAGTNHAVRWDSGVISDLGTLGGNNSSASAINDAGKIVGSANLVDGTQHAVLWDSGTIVDLGTLGGDANSFATAINNNGQIVGYSTANGIQRAVLWENGAATDLTASWVNPNAGGGAQSSSANAINNNGQAVGYILPTYGSQLAMLWSGGTFTDLNTLLPPGGSSWILTEATAINDDGFIVGQGIYYDSITHTSSTHAFLLSPISKTADLSISMIDTPDPVLVGNDLTYSIVVTNNGPLAASGVTVVDDQPSAVTFKLVTSSQGSCNITNNQITCSLGDMAVDAVATVTITATVNVTSPSTFDNKARIYGNEPDGNYANNNAITTTTSLTPPADIGVSLSAAYDPTAVGQNLTYTAIVTNNGPNLATSVSLRDFINTATTQFVSASATQGTCGSYINCSLGNLASGASVTVTIVVTPMVGGTLTNTASVYSINIDPNSSNNTASVSVTVLNTSDLALTMTATPNPTPVGGTLTYQITATNNGPATASNVSVDDILPAGITVVSISSSQGSCSGTSTITCVLGTLASGNAATVAIVASPNVAGSIINSANISAANSDLNLANNTATAEITVVNTADLSVTLTDTPDPVKKGTKLTYTLTITNNGPLTATGIRVTDILPPNIEFEWASTSQGSCSGRGPVNCALGTLSSGSMATVTIVIKPKNVGSNINTATVTGDIPDFNTANNSATTLTTVKR